MNELICSIIHIYYWRIPLQTDFFLPLIKPVFQHQHIKSVNIRLAILIVKFTSYRLIFSCLADWLRYRLCTHLLHFLIQRLHQILQLIIVNLVDIECARCYFSLSPRCIY